MLLVFTFAFDTETKEAAVGGNMESQVALGVLQNIVIAQAVGQAKEIEKTNLTSRGNYDTENNSTL